MKSLFVAIFALLLLIAFVAPTAAQLSLADIAEKESGTQKISWEKTGETLYIMRWTLNKYKKDGQTFVKSALKGENIKQGDERIEWDESSLMVFRPEGLRTLWWKKDSRGAEKMHWSLKYDWDARKVQYAFSDDISGKKENKSNDFDADSLPGDAMNLMLRGFPFEKGAGTEIAANLLMGDGSGLRGRIIHRGEQKIKTALGEIDAYKLEIKPAGALGLVAPDMFAYFTKSKPHIWLRADGRDEGLLKPRTNNNLVEYQPKGRIK
jgi:hypothetical protein